MAGRQQILRDTFRFLASALASAPGAVLPPGSKHRSVQSEVSEQ